MTLTCAACDKAIPLDRKYCSVPCRKRAELSSEAYLKRKAALSERRRLARLGRTCPVCQATFDGVTQRQVYCTSCCQDKARDQRRRQAYADERRRTNAPRQCRDCGVDISHRRRDSVSCTACITLRKNRRAKPKMIRPANKTCQDCPTLIVDLRANAIRCHDCARRAHRKQTSQHIGVRASKTVTAKSKANLVPRTPTRIAPVKEKSVDPKLPNLGAGEGFGGPDWDGCWTVNVPPEGRALIEKHLGRPDPMKQREESAVA